MRILWLTENYPPQRGGMAQSCDRIIRGLRDNKIEVDVVHFADSTKPYRIEKQLGGTMLKVPFEDSEPHVLHRLFTFIERNYEQLDLIVSFGGHLSMLAAPIYTKWLGIPLVTMIRGNDFDQSIFTPRKRKILDDAILNAKAVVTVSTQKADKIKKLYHIDNVWYVPNGIDIKEWKTFDSDISFAKEWVETNTLGKKVIGLFGQLKAKKGVEFFVNALIRSGKYEEIMLLFVGEVEEEIQRSLDKKEVRYFQMEFLDRFELIKFYLVCDAIAIPSFYDGMPNILLEACSLGIPVICSDIDGMRDVLGAINYPLLFPVGDLESCGRKIFEFMTMSKATRASLGERLKHHVQEGFDSKTETCNLQNVFDATVHGYQS